MHKETNLTKRRIMSVTQQGSEEPDPDPEVVNDRPKVEEVGEGSELNEVPKKEQRSVEMKKKLY